MVKLIFLSEAFYEKYGKCREIEQKTDRPYIMLRVNIDGIQWGIPLRSHIKHDYAVWTDKENRCGIDLTKAVVLELPEYVDLDRKPHIRDNEFSQLKRISESWIAEKMRRYISDYKDAKRNPEITRNRMMLQYSTLQYFEQYI